MIINLWKLFFTWEVSLFSLLYEILVYDYRTIFLTDVKHLDLCQSKLAGYARVTQVSKFQWFKSTKGYSPLLLHVHCILAGDSSLELSSLVQDTVRQGGYFLECSQMQQRGGMRKEGAEHTLVLKVSIWKWHRSPLNSFNWPKLSHSLVWLQRGRKIKNLSKKR